MIRQPVLISPPLLPFPTQAIVQFFLSAFELMPTCVLHSCCMQDCAQQLSKHKVVSARQPELPLWLLKQRFSEMVASTDPTAEPKQISKNQAQLLSARAAAGDLAGIQWLRTQGCAWSSHSSIAAAEGGHLDVLRWLLAQRPACPLDAGLCALAAASAGQLHVLQFLQDELLLRPFDLAACSEAAGAAGKQSVLDWLLLQDGALAAPAAFGDQAMAAAARQQVQQIMTFARGRAPLAVSVRA
jgi:hypothetical protein